MDYGSSVDDVRAVRAGEARAGCGGSFETAVIVIVMLAFYVGAVYQFSFNQGNSPTRIGIHAIILALDLVIPTLLLRERNSLAGALRRGNGERLLMLAVFVSLVCVALLHVDYLRTRYRGAEAGVAGPLETLKLYLVLVQISAVVLLASAKRFQTTPIPLWHLLKLKPTDFLLLSLVFIPLVNYLAHNHELFTILTGVEYVAFFLLWPFLILVFMTALQRLLNARVAAAPAVAAFALVYYSMPFVSSLLARPVEWLFPFHVGVALGGWWSLAAAFGSSRRKTAAAVAYVAAGSVLTSCTYAALVQFSGNSQPATQLAQLQQPGESKLATLLASPITRTPDVYLLVYDGYAAPASLKNEDIPDDSLTDYLSRRRFRFYDRAYSVFMSSRPSMISLMNMSVAPTAGIGGNNNVLSFFRHHGYQTHLVLNGYLLQGSWPIVADDVFPPWTARSGLSALYRGIAAGEFKSEAVFEDSDRAEWLAAKRRVLSATTGGARMLYAHSGLPGHSQNSGSCLPDETAQYAARLRVAQREIVEDIEAIERSQRDAIIIIAGDHGPFLTGDCLYMARFRPHDLTATNLADRYGAKLAIRWPSELPERLDKIKVIQDVFLAVFAYLLDDETVWTERVSTTTFGYGGIPNGAVENGTVRIGKDTGKPLFQN